MAHVLADELNTDVTLIHPDKTVEFAGRILKAVGISCVVVVEKDSPVGILTERDIVQKVVAMGRDPCSTAVRDVMTKNLITVSKDTTVEEAVEIMEKNNIKKLPVAENGRVIGIVTMTDMLRILRNIYMQPDGK
ncbi:MAG: CBS domain-containing protein [Candidatus Aenigmarchaeota archaeon]|nr:CBS domain-containing protein [Candidatus Aenigmarchaeota archaeon]